MKLYVPYHPLTPTPTIGSNSATLGQGPHGGVTLAIVVVCLVLAAVGFLKVRGHRLPCGKRDKVGSVGGIYTENPTASDNVL